MCLSVQNKDCHFIHCMQKDRYLHVLQLKYDQDCLKTCLMYLLIPKISCFIKFSRPLSEINTPFLF